MTKKLHIVALSLIVAIYVMQRFSFLDTIEFGYDQPLLTNQILAFLEKPTFINAHDYVTNNPWGYPSWGPMQIFFYTPFVLLSKNPIILSLLIATFNIISVIAIFYTGKVFFSTRVGLFSALLLATHPYWLIFSRMIYQPTPVVTFICLSMFLSFLNLRSSKSKWLGFLPIIWTILFQFYIHTISFIIPSIGLLFLKLKKTIVFYLIFGVLTSIIIFLPVIYFYSHHPNKIFDFNKVNNTFNQLYISPINNLKDITTNFFSVMSGSGWNWQLGYGEKTFFSRNLGLAQLQCFATALVLIIIFIFMVMFIYHKNKIQHLLLFSWLIGPIWFLFLIKSPIALPRYFLISLPSLVLIISIVTDTLLSKLISLKNSLSVFAYLIPICLACVWIYTNTAYCQFVRKFDYPNGFLSNYSDVPYVFVAKSLNWIFKDASEHNIKNIIISNNYEHPKEYDLNVATRYALDNVYNFHYVSEKITDASYIIMLKPAPKNIMTNSVEFGPYIVYKIPNI